MEKNIILIIKKNFFFSKLSRLLEKDGYLLKELTDENRVSEKNLKKSFLFFFLESNGSIKELKKLKIKNYNLVIFKKPKNICKQKFS